MARKVNSQFSHIVDAELVCVCRAKSGHIYKEGWRALKPSDRSHRIEFICFVFFGGGFLSFCISCQIKFMGDNMISECSSVLPSLLRSFLPV